MGIKIGQNTLANIKKAVVRADAVGPPGAVGSVNQSIPSMACWAAKKRGIAASAISARLLTLIRATIPAVPVTATVAKLAVAEKHIERPLLVRGGSTIRAHLPKKNSFPDVKPTDLRQFSSGIKDHL
jgi:hypothetical protein